MIAPSESISTRTSSPAPIAAFIETHAFAIAAVILAALLIVAFGVPGQAVYRARDFLDSALVLYKLRALTPGFFLNLHATLPVLGGLSLNATGLNDFNLQLNLYLLFNAFVACAINTALTRALGFVGMYLLLTRHLLREAPYSRIIAAGTALLFAVMSYGKGMAGTIALQPLLAYAVINICQRRHEIVSALIVLLFPFYSYLVFGGFAVVAALGVAALYALVYRKPYGMRLLLITVGLTVIYLLLEYRLVWLTFFSGFVSDRTGWTRVAPSLRDFVWYFRRDLLDGQYPNYSGQFPVPLLAITLAVPLVVLNYLSKRKPAWMARPPTLWGRFVAGSLLAAMFVPFALIVSRIVLAHDTAETLPFAVAALIRGGTAGALLLAIGFGGRAAFARLQPPGRVAFPDQRVSYFGGLLVGLLLLALIISLIFALETSGVTGIQYWFPIPFQVTRFNILHPLIWQVSFALAVVVLCLSLPRQSRFLAVGFAALALLQGMTTSEQVWPRIMHLAGPKVTQLYCAATGRSGKYCQWPTISQYYRTSVYRELAEKIGRPQSEYAVASLDIEPMIAAFNGFHTIDGYAPNYPLSYKRRFRRVIAAELARSPGLRAYFDGWGSRVSLYHKKSAPNLLIDFCAAYDLGARYILAPHPVDGVPSLKLAAQADDLRAYAIRPDVCAGGKS